MFGASDSISRRVFVVMAGSAVERLAQRRDDPAEHLLADGNRHELPGHSYVGALADFV